MIRANLANIIRACCFTKRHENGKPGNQIGALGKHDVPLFALASLPAPESQHTVARALNLHPQKTVRLNRMKIP